MAVSTFIDESGKFRDHRIICIGCVASFDNHVDEFANEWGRLLYLNGMKNFHTSEALKHHVALGLKNPALGLKERTDALLPFVGCIRKYLAVAIGLWIDVKAFNLLPEQLLRMYGRDPIYMAFVRTILQVLHFIPDRDRMVMVCDEDEETAKNFYDLYRRVKKVHPEAKRKIVAISFCDDHYVFAVQAADFIASMVRLDALARRDKKKHQYRRLFKALTADPDHKHERIWYCGVAKGDKRALGKLADELIAQWKKEKKISA